MISLQVVSIRVPFGDDFKSDRRHAVALVFGRRMSTVVLRSERTLALYRDGVKPLTDRLGARQLRKLTAVEVQSALAGLSGELSSRSLQIARNCLVRAFVTDEPLSSARTRWTIHGAAKEGAWVKPAVYLPGRTAGEL